ncbi:DUF1707 SHOCT-like domain-containing protein [Nocardia sienata]|uniref:DUF1707 SHOCT-like domain-containing protein n=1 Tax=Nocardia sienata TaxID=248552 RepID=UPI001472480F|nr:DUF1707 domain-containing protein [Nocardia sienata]
MTVEPPPEDLPAVRATDNERENAAALIQQAHADGRLDLTELDERLAAVYSSRTRSELEVVTADLSPVAHGGTTDRLVLRSKGSKLARQGAWLVPPQIVVRSEHGRVVLDFGTAVLRSREILVEVDSKHGGVEFVVPQGWIIDLDDMVTEWGRITNKAVPPVAGMPRLRISGRIEHAGITVRHPRRRRWWWPFR